MTDKVDKTSPTREDEIATGLVGNLGLLSKAILSAAKLPVPPVEECISSLQNLSHGKKVGERKREKKLGLNTWSLRER